MSEMLRLRIAEKKPTVGQSRESPGQGWSLRGNRLALDRIDGEGWNAAKELLASRASFAKQIPAK
jgi:hypothetical protein